MKMFGILLVALLPIFQSASTEDINLQPELQLADKLANKLFWASDLPRPRLAIEIKNDLSFVLLRPKTYLKFGDIRKSIPDVIQSNTTDVMIFIKETSLRGIAGIVTYEFDLSSMPYQLAILFSLPHQRSSAKNWFGIALVPLGEDTVKLLYNELPNRFGDPDMIRQDAFAEDMRPILIFQKDYAISATMTSDDASILRVFLEEVPDLFG